MNPDHPALPQARAALAACLLCSAATQVAAAQYDCTDERGVRHRMPQRIEGALIRFDCAPAAPTPDARVPMPVEQRRYSSVLLTLPTFELTLPPARAAQPLALPPLPPRPALFLPPLGALDTMIHATAREFGHDPDLLRAIIKVESGFNARALSPKGAVGLMQLMPATARRFGWEGSASLFTPSLNLEVGARYLAYLKQLFPRNLELAIAAYNAGEGAVIKRNYQIPPYPETQSYVRLVLSAYHSFRAQRVAAADR